MTGGGGDRHSFREIDPVQSLRAPSFEFTELSRHAELPEHDRQLAELARRAATEAVTDRLLELTPVAGGLTEFSLVLGDDDEDLLEDGRANAHAGRYAVALEQLTTYLRTYPGHQEARYLRAFCIYRLDGQDQVEALRILWPLRDEEMPDELRGSVDDLRRELRRLLTPLEITAYDRTSRSDPRGALRRAEAFWQLAPEEGSLSHLVALGQARSGALEQALDTATRGAAEADVDREQVAALARSLLLPVLRPLVAPAATAFKDRNPRLARSELSQLPARWRLQAVVRDFDAYLAQCVAARGRTSLPAPQLPEDRADDVYSLIAETDAQQAAGLMRDGRDLEAERLLARVLLLVPGFRWLNFLYAVCLLRVGRDPDRAAACAEIARRDPTITQAEELLQAVRGWQEATVINPAVTEYIAAMESVRGGASADRLTVLRNRLSALQHKLPTLRSAARTERGRRTVEELGKAIAERLLEVEDAVVVADLYDRYDAIMSTAKGGIRDSAAADRLARSLDTLASQIKELRRRARTSISGGQFDELAQAVAARRAEVERVKPGLQVSVLVRRFNELLEPPSKPEPDPDDPFSSLQALLGVAEPPRPDPVRLLTELTRLRTEAEALRRNARGMDSRDLTRLDELLSAVRSVLGMR
ncbi:hypothetical protein [Streptomyces sp. NPDC001401]|uniref:hypothetical protein n=1 Tax=Streptomyces sp. NPDC001401 TaxID=3364570 RepID=UPI00369A163F